MKTISDARKELITLANSLDVLFSIVPHYEDGRSINITGYAVYIHENNTTRKMWYFGSLDYMVDFLVDLNAEE